jgi:hypothetical protein
MHYNVPAFVFGSRREANRRGAPRAGLISMLRPIATPFAVIASLLAMKTRRRALSSSTTPTYPARSTAQETVGRFCLFGRSTAPLGLA